MNTPVPECPACRVQMQEGFVPEIGRNDKPQPTLWTEGQPEKTFFGFLKVKGRRQFDTVTFRCPKCGWLIWFAPEPLGSDE